MNTKRYVIAGAVSIALHGVLLSAVPNKMVMAMPVGADSTKVSLNLVSAPAPQPAPAAVEPPPPAPKPEPKPIQKETEVKKLVKKKQPEPKPEPKKAPEPVVKKTPPKPVKKVEPKVVKQPVAEKKAPVPEKKPEQKPPVAKTKPLPKSEAASGVNNSPKLVTKPTFATRPSPVKYPRIAKRRGLEGQVLVEVWIDEKGKQVKHNLVQSSGAIVLDEAALDAIKRWRFSSHIVDGQAIAHRVQIPVRFKLD
ncbi:energy transducer TonB [Photobacterium sanctipauli]|uniref:Protein TonB n=1 Tax=Photobacterium sanctipauli TaxID=1342794 RepID=A0A2T3NYL6_9GAMM|nr:energy transducer TonB [Photobacterium sanctipauli]PSW21322.1 energy transducer TonB [Photobacterium sanctipauli]